MKSAPFCLAFSAVMLTAGSLSALIPDLPYVEPGQEQPPSADTNERPNSVPESPAITPTETPETPTAPPTTPAAAPASKVDPQNQNLQKSDEGFIIKDAGINDIFQFLSKSAGRQYFHNAKIAGPEFAVTGHLNEGNPLQQMEELAFMYGLTLHTKGSTIYALTSAQLNQLPSAEFHYQLRYLRPTDMEQIKELIKPMLSPGTGIVNFEPKTNTIIIIDSAHRIEQAKTLLHGIDMAKGQIIVETKILRVNSTAAQRTGVNWATSLGKDGTALDITAGLNSLFGLQSPFVTSTTSRILTPPSSIGSTIVQEISGSGGASNLTTSTSTSNSGGITGGSTRNSTLTSGPNLVLSPIQLTGVLRALAEGGLASQVSNPTLITEDNEQATISIIDRIPIITTTTTASSSASANPTITEQVRYKIDSGDKSIDTDPEKHREIGISMVVTPTLLPDGTIRMKLRPRSAQIVENIISITGNKYPRVTESMVESLARVPDGYSLVVGGFYGEAQSNAKTKIPLLGDVPMLNFFFKSKDATKEKTSLVFVVTPKSYDPTNPIATRTAGQYVRSTATLSCDSTWIDPENPGPAHEPNMKRSIRDIQPAEAPYFPRADESIAPPNPVDSPNPGHSKTHFSRGGRN